MSTTHRDPEILVVDTRGHSMSLPESGAAEFFVHQVDDHKPYLMSVSLSHSCEVCDEFMGWSLDETRKIAVAKTECTMTEGFTTVIEIDVLTGQLICDDDLRDAEVFEAAQEHDYEDETQASYNSTLGQAQVIERSAAVGLAYGPCLNTSPTLYEIEPGKYVVASGWYDEDIDEEINSPGKPVAEFCTDLWAFSMADYSTYLDAGGYHIEEDDKYGTRTVIDIPPGRYRMTYHGGEAGFDYHAPNVVVFAEFERIPE